MLKGDEVKNKREFLMKKVHLTRTSKEQSIIHFSILHLRNFERRANKNKYNGKIIFFNKNKPFPIGYKNDNDTAVLPSDFPVFDSWSKGNWQDDFIIAPPIQIPGVLP